MLLWWFFPQKIVTNPFIKIISTKTYELCSEDWKLNCLQLNFVYRYNASDFEKKEQSNQSIAMAKKKLYWNLKYQIQDPIFPHEYELNIVNAETS